MQVAVQSCEANCLSGHGHEQKMSHDHSCCKGKKHLASGCKEAYKSNEQHNCLHQLIDINAVLEPSKLEASIKEQSIKSDLISIVGMKTNLLAYHKSIERIPDLSFYKFKSSFSIYLRQRKLLI